MIDTKPFPTEAVRRFGAAFGPMNEALLVLADAAAAFVSAFPEGEQSALAIDSETECDPAVLNEAMESSLWEFVDAASWSSDRA